MIEEHVTVVLIENMSRFSDGIKALPSGVITYCTIKYNYSEAPISCHIGLIWPVAFMRDIKIIYTKLCTIFPLPGV